MSEKVQILKMLLICVWHTQRNVHHFVYIIKRWPQKSYFTLDISIVMT